jgi:hypothetical protein
MEIKPLKRINPKDGDLNSVQLSVKEYLDQLAPNMFLIGNLLEITVTTTATEFNHGLQKTPFGWFVLDKTANADIWRTAWDSKTITLDATASATIKLWVF